MVKDVNKHPKFIEEERQKELIELAKAELKDQLEEELNAKEIINEANTKIINLLENPNFLDILIEEIQNKKVVGERDTIEAIFLITNSRKVTNIQPTSSNLFVNDESGLGKDFITKAVLNILPKEDVVYRTKITPELFTYWHNPKYEPEWNWNGKIFYLEDASSKIINSDVFKVFSSGGSKSTVLVKQTPIDIEIKGKPSMIVTSAEANPNNENLRRYPICFLDSSDEQTLQIMIRQSEEDVTGNSMDYDTIIIEALRKLQRVKVVIPYAKKLPNYFPKNRFMRTHFKRFLDYIKSSASLYQYQRKQDKNGNVIANKQDYEIARRVLLKTASNPSMIPLTRQLQGFLDFFEKNTGKWFCISDIENKFPVSERTLQKWVKKLYKYHFLKADSEYKEGIKRPVSIYSYNEINKIEIPTWSSINSVNSVNTFNSVNSVNDLSDKQQEKEKIILNELNESNELVFNEQK